MKYALPYGTFLAARGARRLPFGESILDWYFAFYCRNLLGSKPVRTFLAAPFGPWYPLSTRLCSTPPNACTFSELERRGTSLASLPCREAFPPGAVAATVMRTMTSVTGSRTSGVHPARTMLVVAVGTMGRWPAWPSMVSPSLLAHRPRGWRARLRWSKRSARARELAISQRRNVELAVRRAHHRHRTRVDIGAAACRPDDRAPHGRSSRTAVQFALESSITRIRRTRFGRRPPSRSALGTTPRMFTSDGTFVDQDGDLMNGTMFLAIPQSG